MVNHSGQAVEISARWRKRSLQVASMLAAAMVYFSTSGLHAAHADESQQASNCSALQQTNIKDTLIKSAQVLPAGSVFKDPDGKPVTTSVKICRVVATVSTEPAEQVGIEVWLPLDGWNGRLLGVGSAWARAALVARSSTANWRPPSRVALSRPIPISAGGGASADCALYEPGSECSFARSGCAGQDGVAGAAAASDAASATRSAHVTGAGQSLCLSARPPACGSCSCARGHLYTVCG